MAPVPGVHADLVADRSVDRDHRRHRAGGAAARADAARGEGENHREIFRLARRP